MSKRRAQPFPRDLHVTLTTLPRIGLWTLCALALSPANAFAQPAAPDCRDAGASTALGAYIGRPDASFRWERVREEVGAEGTLADVRLVSQTWQGAEWAHYLLVFIPAGEVRPDLSLLVLRDGLPGETDAAALRTISRATGTAAAYLYGVPNQPLFGGREEDPLLAHTFSEYLRTGDHSWPLLFPMAKSALRAMDVIQSLGPGIERFVVAGHSKRGQTAWLAGAADARVAGILPIASDVLNSPAQIQHHLEVAGGITGSSSVFAETIGAASTPRGRCLLEMIDPYSYRADLAEPKLIVLATNDDYTPSDALNLYWDDLSGKKSVLYLPNTAHVGANSHPDVNPTAFAFVRGVAMRGEMPRVDMGAARNGDVAEVRVAANAAVSSAVVWAAYSATRDFRGVRWQRWEMRPLGAGETADARVLVAFVPIAPTGYTAVLGELVLGGEGAPYKLSTRMEVIDARPGLYGLDQAAVVGDRDGREELEPEVKP